MHIDARELDNDTLIEGDLCIIGAGAAGISIALEWLGSSKKVILLESGGFNVQAQMQALFKGEAIDPPYYPLQSAVVHLFGGPGRPLGRVCSPLRPLAFHKP